jgi:hypothetical protein
MATRKKVPVEQVRSHSRRNHKHGTKPSPNQLAMDMQSSPLIGCKPASLTLARMTADEVLHTAHSHITERSIYDTKAGQERSFKRTAAVFNALTGKDLSASDVAILQTCLKLVRWQTAKEADRAHDDSAVDGSAYLALAHEELLVELGETQTL